VRESRLVYIYKPTHLLKTPLKCTPPMHLSSTYLCLIMGWIRIRISHNIVRPFFARSAPPRAMRCGRRTRRSLPSVHSFSVGWIHRSDPLECTFRGFLLIGDPFRFRWAQAPCLPLKKLKDKATEQLRININYE
jgi:hypothetical protein